MINFIANLFGYLLNYIYCIFNNFGLAIIFFTVILKLILLPITIKNQKTMEKTAKIQEELKALQFKYKNDSNTLFRETANVYKRENISRFGGCLNSIIQIILLIAVLYIVQSPLTYMKKVDVDLINNYANQLQEKTRYSEVEIIKQFGNIDSRVYVNMDFCGINLSNIPNQNLTDIKTIIIPVLYVISSIISSKLTLNNQKLLNQNSQNEDMPAMPDPSKTMIYMIPILAFSVSLVAPLGLALYWLLTNILMIFERLFFDLKNKKNEGKI